jgi:DNA-binding response OmpR family regulator
MGKMSQELASHTRVFDMAVTRLRQRLRAAQLHEVVVSTVRGVGYCVDIV